MRVNLEFALAKAWIKQRVAEAQSNKKAQGFIRLFIDKLSKRIFEGQSRSRTSAFATEALRRFLVFRWAKTSSRKGAFGVMRTGKALMELRA